LITRDYFGFGPQDWVAQIAFVRGDHTIFLKRPVGRKNMHGEGSDNSIVFVAEAAAAQGSIFSNPR
jgi:hypothetical protein